MHTVWPIFRSTAGLLMVWPKNPVMLFVMICSSGGDNLRDRTNV
jgi:hypothetical protein